MSKHTVPDEMKIIGHNLRAIRESFGLSQQDMGKMLKISFQQIQKYEHGKNRLPVEKLFLLKQLLNIPYESFFVGLETKTGHFDILDLKTSLMRKLDRLEDHSFKRKIHTVLHILLH